MNRRTVLLRGVARILPAIAVGYFLIVLNVAQPGLHAATKGYQPWFAKLRDTLFVADSTFLEIRLDHQMIYQHFRSGRVERYPCSTGNPAILDGIATRQGIFTIQSKAKKTLSEQFQVYLNYWMGFDGGIGFHGLDGRSYYRFLGRRVSSHGCVRISNETGAKLFGVVPMGTVVFVHGGSPARVVAFADTAAGPNSRPIYEFDKAVLKRRLDAVREGRWQDSALMARMVIPSRKRLSERVDVGSVDPNFVVQFPIPIVNIPIRPAAFHPPIQAVPPLRYRPTTDTSDDA